MKLRTLCCLTIVLVVVCTSLAWGLTQSQERKEEPPDVVLKLSRRIETFNTGDTNFIEALHHLAHTQKVPMGVEWVKTPEATSRLDIGLHDRTLQQVLDALVETQSDYKWRVENGVVHIFPNGLAADPRNLLNVHVPLFSIKEQGFALAQRNLHRTVQRVINPDLYKGGWGGHTTAGQGWEKKVSVELRNATVRQALNALVRVYGEAIWIVTFPEDLRVDPNGYWAVTFPRKNASVGTDLDSLWLLVPLSWRDPASWQ